jgi:N-acetylglucosaminyldiphosphoundecaprenol N-acetyl-beta-D-mannosaminyltransferase
MGDQSRGQPLRFRGSSARPARERVMNNHLAANPARQLIGGVPFVCLSPISAALHIIALATSRSSAHVHLANAYSVALADQREEYFHTLQLPAINFPDGKPLSWVSRLRGDKPALQQVRGPQFFLDVFDHGRKSGVKHFLLGSTPEVLERLVDELLRRFPGAQIVGVESPPFRLLSTEELQLQDARISQSNAHIVWVGLGTPKQDFEVRRIASTLPVTAVAIGAAFDFTAGTLKEAPSWMSHAGLEWAYRFASEPRRLWRRYVFGNARFLKAAVFPRARG